MLSARVIKQRIQSIKNIQKITKTMEMVATTKSKRIVGQVNASKYYLGHLYTIIQELMYEKENITSPLIVEQEHKTNKVLIFLVTSNRGLCGAYNSHVIKKAMSFYHQFRNDGKDVTFHVAGKKGISALKFAKILSEKTYNDIDEKIGLSYIGDIAKEMITSYINCEYDEIYFVTTELFSSISHKPVLFRLLPLSLELPQFAKVFDENKLQSQKWTRNYLFEPSIDNLFEYVLPTLIDGLIFHKLLEANASEQISRQMAMHQATISANDMIKEFTRSYNRARQYKITQELSEIVGGAEALK